MEFRFGAYRLDVAARRLARRGEPIVLEPRPFALLVHLVRERRRVVPREELHATVWRGEPASNDALARAVLKLRRAFGAPDGDEIIRTVARVGYRFVEPADPAADAAHPAPTTAATPAVALLPVRNATADASLAWLEMGLMALTVRHLEGHPVVTPVSVPAVMAALDRENSDAGLRRATGARIVVHGRLVRGRGGDLRLVYRASGAVALRGMVAAERAIDLAAGLADALVQALDPAAPASRPREPHDALADEAYARGVQALTAHHWGKAAKLLQLAMDLEPDRTDVQLELLRALGNLGDEDMLPLASRLLDRAGRERDAMLEARVHQALGRLHLNRGDFAQGDRHLELSLERAAGQGGADWTARTLMLRASVANIRLQPADALQFVGRMYEHCERSGDRMLPVAGLCIEAVASAACGDLERALTLSIEATRRARDLRANSYLINACDSAAWHLARLGRLADAAAYAEDAVAAAMSSGSIGDAWGSMPTLCWVYRLADTPQAARAALARMPDPAALPCPENDWRARGLLAAAEGRHAEAAHWLGRAVQRHRDTGNCYEEEQTLPWFIDALVLGGRLDEADAELAQARSARLAGSVHMHVNVQHAMATLAHARGRRDEAAALLRRVVDSAAAPLWRALACIDLAWLESEAGRRDAALGLLERLPPALADHPLARAARSRADVSATACAPAPFLPSRR